jgi:predicted O-methyltransferase YrrM
MSEGSPGLEAYLNGATPMSGMQHVDDLLAELYEFGQREGGMWNVGPEGGALLAWLVGLTNAHRVLEIGTSNGYSAIWLARALAGTGGEMVSLEMEAFKAEMARANLKRAGLHERVTIVEGPALVSLQVLGGPFQLVFIDADKGQYPDYLAAVRTLAEPGAVIVADNMTTHPEETAAYRNMADADPGLENVQLNIGGGLYLSRVIDGVVGSRRQ